MSPEAEERYLEWLEREEERLGTDAVTRASMDIEELKKMLLEELGYEPTEEQLNAFMGAGTTKYEAMPKIGVSYRRFEGDWGYLSRYRDTKTGRFVSYTYVKQATARLEL